MMTLKLKKSVLSKILFVAMCSCFAMTAFAEEAPVYDVDNYPPQFDEQASQDAAQPTGPQASASNPQDARSAQPDQPSAPGMQAENSIPGYLRDQDSPPDQEPAAGYQAQAQDNSNANSNVPAYVPPPPNLPLDERVARLEQQLSNAMNSDSFTKFSNMQAQIQSLRGQIDVLNHQLELLQKQQKAMYADLEKRVNHSPTISEDNYEQTGDKPKTVAVKKIEKPLQPNTAEEQQIYQQAYSLIKAKKYNEAAATFEKMLQKYPSGQFAANAHYWLGELYGLMGNNEKALNEFNTIVKDYPTSPKLADAQLKLGLIYTSQQKWSDAKSSFKKVVTRFPGTSFARLATEQLKQIKSSGH